MDEVIALDLEGNVKWRASYGRTWNESFPEARSTPTIDNNKLYVASGLGDVACLEALNGKIIWKVNAAEKYEAILNLWGISESLLIVDDKVIFSPVGNQTTIIALDKQTGEEIWASKSIQDSTGLITARVIGAVLNGQQGKNNMKRNGKPKGQ